MAAHSQLPPTFHLTLLHVRAAVANLLAEVLHPECHWTGALEDVQAVVPTPAAAPMGGAARGLGSSAAGALLASELTRRLGEARGGR